MNTLFLHTNPFSVRDTQLHRVQHLRSYLDETDRMDEKRIHSLLAKFCLEQGILQRGLDGNLEIIPNEVLSSWKYHLISFNFRSLIDETHYNKLMASLQAGEGNALQRVLDLHVRIGSSFDDVLLNTLVNRLYQSLSLIPQLGFGKDAWEKVHQKTPFLWVFILIQTVIRSEVILKF